MTSVCASAYIHVHIVHTASGLHIRSIYIQPIARNALVTAHNPCIAR